MNIFRWYKDNNIVILQFVLAIKLGVFCDLTSNELLLYFLTLLNVTYTLFLRGDCLKNAKKNNSATYS